MQAEIVGQVGPQTLSDGAGNTARQGKTGELVIQQLHGRFFEQTYRGNIFSGGMNLTSISNVTFAVATTDATATPICGLWNPTGSGVNAVILQAFLNVIMTALQATGCGGFTWTIAAGNTLTTISTGAAAYSNLTLLQTGARCRNMAGAALTSKTNALVAMRGAGLNGGSSYNASLLGTAAGFQTNTGAGSIENFDGSLIVPPGGVLALQCNSTPVAHSATSGIVWEEVPI